MENTILEKYPSNKRLYKSSDSKFNGWRNNSCIFGMAHHNDPLPFIDSIPSNITGFYSYFAEGSYDILKNLIENKINENLEHLTLGFEHSNAKYGYKDYSKISELLSTVKFPKLKSFQYGIDYLLVNEEQYDPHLGNLTNVLNNMPSIEKLDLCGSFELVNKISLKNIKEIFITDYDTESTNGIISGQTLDFLMNSDFESLENFQIALEANNNFVYHFKEDILLKNIDKLKWVAIDGKFQKGTKEKLFKILNTKVEKLSLEIIEE
ncbi:MAG: hypothetical protein RLZZ540_1700 [Bacteroidota bacterium]|jgi:hypothetical protein